jgi:hypothetical protein
MRNQFGSNVTFVLMNSFSTSADTRAALSQAHPELLQEPLIELLQNKSPKVDAATLDPATHAAAPDNEWCAARWSLSACAVTPPRHMWLWQGGGGVGVCMPCPLSRFLCMLACASACMLPVHGA